MSEPPGQAVTSYLDSSALVKRYLVETGTPCVQRLCDDPAQTVAVSEIGLVEIAAAVALRVFTPCDPNAPIASAAPSADTSWLAP